MTRATNSEMAALDPARLRLAEGDVDEFELISLAELFRADRESLRSGERASNVRREASAVLSEGRAARASMLSPSEFAANVLRDSPESVPAWIENVRLDRVLFEAFVHSRVCDDDDARRRALEVVSAVLDDRDETVRVDEDGGVTFAALPRDPRTYVRRTELDVRPIGREPSAARRVIAAASYLARLGAESPIPPDDVGETKAFLSVFTRRFARGCSEEVEPTTVELANAVDDARAASELGLAYLSTLLGTRYSDLDSADGEREFRDRAAANWHACRCYLEALNPAAPPTRARADYIAALALSASQAIRHELA